MKKWILSQKIASVKKKLSQVFEKLWQNPRMEAFIIAKGRPPCKDFKIGLQKLEIIFFLRRLLNFFTSCFPTQKPIFTQTSNINNSIIPLCKIDFHTIFANYTERSFRICLWFFCVTSRKCLKIPLKKVVIGVYWLKTTESQLYKWKIVKFINVQFKWNILHDLINLCM